MQGLPSTSAHLWAPREGRGEVAISNFVPFFVDPRECRDYPALPPTCGPLEKAGVRQPLLILSPCLGTPENAAGM